MYVIQLSFRLKSNYKLVNVEQTIVRSGSEIRELQRSTETYDMQYFP